MSEIKLTDKSKKTNGLFVISLEGNIGSGKSTIIETLRSHINNGEYSGFYNGYPLVLSEPVDKWESELKDFYNDRSKSPRYLQEIIMNSIVSQLQSETEAGDVSVIITERSIISSQYIFAKNLVEKGEMTGEEYNELIQIFNTYDIEYKPKACVYIRCSPGKCLERIRKRNRHGEENINLKYITELNDIHERWLESVNNDEVFPSTAEFGDNIVRTPLILNSDEDGIVSTNNICHTIMAHIKKLLVT